MRVRKGGWRVVKDSHCEFCGPLWPLLETTPPPSPEPEDDLLSYWRALGMEPTLEEHYDQLDQEIAELEKDLDGLDNVSPETRLTFAQKVRDVRERFTVLTSQTSRRGP